MFEPICFSVEGRAVPQGSKQGFVPSYKEGNVVRRHKGTCPGRTTHGPYVDANGRDLCRCPIMVNTIDDNDKTLGPWREAIGWSARMAYKGEVIEELIVASFEFVKPRPKSHYGTGRNADTLKDSAPAAPGNRPDVLKLARAAEDALTGVLYHDDSLIVTELISKRYCPRTEPERVNITIRAAEAQTVGDLVAAGRIELPEAAEQFEQIALAV